MHCERLATTNSNSVEQLNVINPGILLVGRSKLNRSLLPSELKKALLNVGVGGAVRTFRTTIVMFADL